VRTRVALALLVAAVAASCAGFEHEGTGSAVLSLASDGTPEIRYFLPRGEDEVHLVEQSDHTEIFARKNFWSFDHRCFALDGARLRRLKPGCGDPVIRLDWDEAQRDRMYPGLVRLRNGGVLVFTGYVQPLDRNGQAVTWRAIAPQGGVASYLDEKSTRFVRIGPPFPGDSNGWIYLGPDRFISHPFARVLVDDGIAPRLADEMLQAAPRLLQTFTTRLGKPLPRRPIFFLTWINRDRPSDSFQADVVDGPVVKFTLSGRRWKNPSPEAIDDFRFVEAHEFAHFWNRSSKPSTPWVAEGGAEVLGWAAMHAAGFIDDRALADHVDAAFNECAILAGGYAWSAIPGHDHGRYPYACGAALQFLAIALAHEARPSVDTFALWKGVLRGDASDENAMKASLQRASAPAAEAVDALLHSDRPLVAAFEEMIHASGLRARPVDPATIGPELREAVAKRTFMALMVADCAGNGGFRLNAHELVTDPLDGCRSFHGEMRIATIEGAPILDRPIEALRRVRSSCAGSKAASIATEDGRNLRISCDASTPLPHLNALRTFDPIQVARLFDGGAGGHRISGVSGSAQAPPATR
jgi:hypothetical protein